MIVFITSSLSAESILAPSMRCTPHGKRGNGKDDHFPSGNCMAAMKRARNA
jgi:hypothetical protein